MEAGDGPRGGVWDEMLVAPHPMPPPPVWSEDEGTTSCLQTLYYGRGETTTGWQIDNELFAPARRDDDPMPPRETSSRHLTCFVWYTAILSVIRE
ncbi:MAG: hypothetical protein HN742_35765 [Lentisphaerae bacterium]|jgi:hypothetical protein|nr:hypothetical protein [Lentisphaerota bacterium]MBT4816359.1 hypothetical protein [Lentisphaerota bacterium]MBT5612425.1 hypothetical protein [Lentisphaerota bacterium]MBT7057131.1 hypothetical protein [Lentisphaerota bacterium]MBT7847283.1 hypothetical protein [Lentisphaerota bacterium]